MNIVQAKANITLIYITNALMWGRFFIPVLALFYIASNVTLEEFTIIMGLFNLFIFLSDIPSSILADLIGKKNVLIIARCTYVIEIIIVAFFNGFWPFLIAKCISGIGVGMTFNTDSSLLYDTLKTMKKEQEHKKVYGLLLLICDITKAAVFVVGGFLFAINPKIPAFVSLPFIILGLILTFFITEPYIKKKRISVTSTVNHFKESINIVKNNKFLKYLFWFSIPIFSVCTLILGISSVYISEIKIPVVLIGIIGALSPLISGIASKKAHDLEEKLGEKKTFLVIQIGAIAGMFLMSLLIPYIGVLFYFIISFVNGFFYVVMKDYANKHLISSHRTTGLSIIFLLNNMGSAIAFPLFGYITKTYSFQIAFICFGILLIVYFITLFLFFSDALKTQKRHNI